MTIPIEDGTPAGMLDIRHHYFEFIPEDQADRDRARDRRGDRAGRGPQLLHRADHRRRPVPLQHLRPGPLRRLSRHDPADRVPQQGCALLEPDRREALRAPGDRGRAKRPSGQSASSSSRISLLPSWAEPPYLLAAGRGRTTWRSTAPTDRLAAAVEDELDGTERRVCQSQARHPPTRPSPHRPDSRRARGRNSRSDGWPGAAERSNSISSLT